MKTRFLLAALITVMALPAAAQTAPTFDVSGGYSLLRSFSDAGDTNQHGWVGSVSGNITPVLGIVGEVGGNYKTVSVLGTDIDTSIYSFMAGPRFSKRGSQTITPFVQVLVGATRSSVDTVLTDSLTSTDFAIQPGAGVDFWLRPNAGIRVGADYRRILGDADLNQFRFTVGVVLSGGR